MLPQKLGLTHTATFKAISTIERNTLLALIARAWRVITAAKSTTFVKSAMTTPRRSGIATLMPGSKVSYYS